MYTLKKIAPCQSTVFFVFASNLWGYASCPHQWLNLINMSGMVCYQTQVSRRLYVV